MPDQLRHKLDQTTDNATVFIDGIEQQFDLDFTVTQVGRNDPRDFREWWVGIKDPDALISTALSDENLEQLSAWYGDADDQRMSVVGFEETGMSLTASRSKQDLARFIGDCSNE